MCDVNLTQPYSVGATYNEPYNENCKHFCQSYVSARWHVIAYYMRSIDDENEERKSRKKNYISILWVNTAVSCTCVFWKQTKKSKCCYPIVCQPSFAVWYFPSAKLYCRRAFLSLSDACLRFVSWCSMPFSLSMWFVFQFVCLYGFLYGMIDWEFLFYLDY